MLKTALRPKGIVRRFKLKKTRVARMSRPKRKKATKADFKRSWGIHPAAWMRYSGLKGVYWHYLSKLVRERDYKEHDGLCMTCELFVEKGDDQAGHLFAAANCGFNLLFYPLNIHLQHSKCNNPRFTPSAGIYNALTINKRYGAGTVETLAEMKRIKSKEWSKQEYESRIADLIEELKGI